MKVILKIIVTQCSILRESLITFWLWTGTNFINRKAQRKLSIGNVVWPNSWGEHLQNVMTSEPSQIY